MQNLVVVDDAGLRGLHGECELLVELFCPGHLARELGDALADPGLADAQICSETDPERRGEPLARGKYEFCER